MTGHDPDDTYPSAPLPAEPVPSSFSSGDGTFATSSDPLERTSGGTRPGAAIALVVVSAVVVLGLLTTGAVAAYSYFAEGFGLFDRSGSSSSSGGGDNERVDREDWMTDLAAPAVRDSLYENCAVMVLPLFDFDGLHEDDVDQLNCIIMDDVVHPETGVPFDVYSADIISDPEAVEQAADLPSRHYEELPVEAEPVEPGHTVRTFWSGTAMTVYDIQDGGIARYTVYNSEADDLEPFLRAIGLIR